MPGSGSGQHGDPTAGAQAPYQPGFAPRTSPPSTTDSQLLLWILPVGFILIGAAFLGAGVFRRLA